MRYWYTYLPKRENKNTSSRFQLTDETLIDDNKIIEERFKFDKFKKYQISIKTYNFLKKNLKKYHTFFIGSSWGWVEFFLSKSFPVIASDINKKYIDYHKKKGDLEYIKFDILNTSDIEKMNKKFSQIVVNNIEYLFDENQILSCMDNLHLITKNNADIFFIFRSRDSAVIRIIDNWLLPLENKLKTIIKNLKGNNWYFTKNHHGFRRSENEFIKIIKKNNFRIEYIYKDLFEAEYNKLNIVKMLRLSKFLSKIFLKSHPLLTIFHLKKL